mgnify:CR=1 FL=1
MLKRHVGTARTSRAVPARAVPTKKAARENPSLELDLLRSLVALSKTCVLFDVYKSFLSCISNKVDAEGFRLHNKSI